MPRPKLNLDWRIGGNKCRVRERGCSSSSSSSLVRNSKRVFWVGKRRGGSSSTPAAPPPPVWKMTSSTPPSDKALRRLSAATRSREKANEVSVSARKLAAALWEINDLPSPMGKKYDSEEKGSVIEGIVIRKESVSEEFKSGATAICGPDLLHRPVYETMNQPKVGSHRRRLSATSHKHLQADLELISAKPPHNRLDEVDHAKVRSSSPRKHITGGSKNPIKDLYNSLITSKELLKVMTRVCHFEEQKISTSSSLFRVLKFELDRSCAQVRKLIQEQRANTREEYACVQERERIHSGAVASISRELEKEKKMRRRTERLSAKLGKELSETKLSLSEIMKEVEIEKRAREILGQTCGDVARGTSEDRAEAEELRKQSEEVLQEVSEKHGERGDDSSSCERIRELEVYLRKTLPVSCQHQENREENDDSSDDSDDGDLCSVELSLDDTSNKFLWTKRNSVEKINGRRKEPNIEREKTEDLDGFDRRGLFEFSSRNWKNDTGDEIERYNLIKNLRDHIVSASKLGSSSPSSSQELAISFQASS